MHAADTMGLILVAISAVLFATLWQQWHDASGQTVRSDRQRQFQQRRIRRRLVANLLVGLVGLALAAIDSVPRTPLSMTAYLLALVVAAAWIMWLGLIDWRASRWFRDEQQLDQLAAELHRGGALKKSPDA